MTVADNHLAEKSELGKRSEYKTSYSPESLFPIPRRGKREEIGINPDKPLPFYGFDYWNHYEVSWLNLKGKPMVALAEIIYDCQTPFIIESKSLKLYFNSLNNTRFSDKETVAKTIQTDLERCLNGVVQVKLFLLHEMPKQDIRHAMAGYCLDDLDIDCHTYQPDPGLLKVNGQIVTETLYSNLLKSNCLVTEQPDWGTVQIEYTGPQISHESLLQYIVSFREHNEFHEQCIERIFMDISRVCKPKELTVYGRYTRRGGIDINPFRSSKVFGAEGKNLRLVRQ